MVKKMIKNEAGFTMVQTLATFILVTLLGMGLILFAFQVSEQITATQGISQKKNQKNFVTQEAKLSLDSKLEEVFSEENLKKNPLGMNDGVLKKLMTEFVNSNQILNEGKFQKTSSASYQNKISTFTIDSMGIVSPGEDDEQGWLTQSPANSGITYHNYQIKIPVESTINDKKGNYTVNSDYIYEIQWESKKAGDMVTENDIWGNMYYQVNKPGGVQVLSADTVIRKMASSYHFQDDTKEGLIPFPERDLSNKTLGGYYGIEAPYTVDVNDGNKIFNHSVSHLEFEGSMIAENGFSLTGATDNSLLVTKNLLALTNQSDSLQGMTQSKIEGLNIDSRAGMYLSVDSETRSRDGSAKNITINNDGSQISTTNLLINQAIDDTNENVGVFITGGNIDVGPTKNDVTDYREYKGNSNSLNLQRFDWDQYQKGNMIISNSKVELAPNRSSAITVNIANNFMLTNAGMSSDLDEDSFSYFKDEGREKIKQPSELILSGKNTTFAVSGYSFLDAPKRNQRALQGETSTEKQVYITNQGLNKISLKDSSKMELGYTGVEAFELESEKGTVFSMKVLPDVTLFNPLFLEKGFKNGNIDGKVVLETSKNDSGKLINQLAEKNIPYQKVTTLSADYNNCQNGVVTVYENPSERSQGTYQFVTRYFSYLTDIAY